MTNLKESDVRSFLRTSRHEKEFKAHKKKFPIGSMVNQKCAGETDEMCAASVQM
jgi:hypothetical protein